MSKTDSFLAPTFSCLFSWKRSWFDSWNLDDVRNEESRSKQNAELEVLHI